MAFFKKYSLVIVGAVLVSAFTALPSLFFFQRMGEDFRGVYPMFNADALYYQARVQEIADGHPELNHPYFFEHKDVSYPQAVGAEYAVYGLTKISGVSAPALQIAFNILLPALIFFLTYLLLKRFSSNEYTAVLFSALVYTFAMGGLFKPMHPQITLPLLLLFLLFWSKLVMGAEKKWRYSVLAGIFLGLLFLTYFYHWSFVVVVVGLYALLLVLHKSFLELKYHGLMVGIAGVIGLPYFIRVWQGMGAPFAAETAARVGVYFSHLPESYPRLAVALIWLVLFVWLVRRFRLHQSNKARLVGVLLAANVLYPNHQIITGVIIQNAVHWSWMPLIIFAVAGHWLIGAVRGCGTGVRSHVAVVVIVLAVLIPAWRLYTFTWQSYVDKYHDGAIERRQYYADVFDWIRRNTEPDAVVFSDLNLMGFIPVYTQANVYYTRYAYNLPSSDIEVVERALLSNFFEPDFFESSDLGINGDGRMLWSFPYESEKNTHTLAGRWTIPYEPQYSIEKEREKVRTVYDSLLREGWDASLLKKYRIDYIIWDQQEKPEWNLESYAELEEIARIGDVSVYQFAR